MTTNPDPDQTTETGETAAHGPENAPKSAPTTFRYRSAVTGGFVSRATAEADPERHIRVTIRRRQWE